MLSIINMTAHEDTATYKGVMASLRTGSAILMTIQFDDDEDVQELIVAKRFGDTVAVMSSSVSEEEISIDIELIEEKLLHPGWELFDNHSLRNTAKRGIKPLVWFGCVIRDTIIPLVKDEWMGMRIISATAMDEKRHRAYSWLTRYGFRLKDDSYVFEA